MTNFSSYQDGPQAHFVGRQALSFSVSNINYNYYHNKKQQITPSTGDSSTVAGPHRPMQHHQSSHRMARSSSNQRAASALPTSSHLHNNRHSSRYLSRQSVVDQADLQQQQQQQQRRRSSNNNHHGDSGARSSNSNTQQEVWNSIEDLFWDHMREVQNKWNTLKMNDDIWAKLIYFEQNRRLAKAYVSAPVLTIDGSTSGLDGFRIGLSGIDNSYRGLDSIACLRSIGQGVKLKIDSQGNILMRRIGPPANAPKSGSSGAPTFEQCSVWVKDWPSVSPTTGRSTSASLSSSSMSSSTNLSSSDLSSSSLAGPSAESWHMRQINEMDVSYKIFDMNKFRQQLERRRHLNSNSNSNNNNNNNNNNHNLTMDWRQCVSIISFVRTKFNEPPNNSGSPQKTILRDPCWLMLINIIAIDMLKTSIREATSAGKSAKTAPSTNMSPQQLPKPDYSSPMELNNIPHRPKLAPRQPPTRQTILDYEPFSEPGPKQPANQQLRASCSIASLYSPTQQQQPIYRTSQVDLDRLTRLNNIRYGANRFLAGSRPHSISTQHLLGYPNDGANNNVIYTTFTGKYTNNQTPRPTRPSASYLADYSSTSDYNSTSKSSSYSRNKPPHKEPVNSPSNYHQNELYPPDRQATNRWPQARPYELSSRSKSQSLSNFDWSHHQRQSHEQPLKKSLDLRSMRTSSIKMNFDDDDHHHHHHQNDHNENGNDAAELEVDADEEGPADRQVSAGIVSQMADRFGKEPLLKTNSSGGRRVSSNWSTRPARRDGRLEQTSQEAATTTTTKYSKVSEPDVINEEEGEQLDLDGQDQNGHSNQDSGNKAQTKLGKLKVSRSSIASTHSSSSSGCPENDYFISNSSSSMSSSTGSQECELFSQPASSSGIVCSGNTSDEYEMDARNKRQHVSSNGVKNQSNTKTSDNEGLPSKMTSKSKKDTEQANSQDDNNVEKNQKQPVQSDKKESQLRHQKLASANNRSKQHIRAISRNRCHNVKTVDMDGEQTDDIICGHHYSNQQSCDCDELASGGKERLGASDDANACDCCCDCFVDIYQTPPPIDANVQVDRCDCGHVEPSDNQFQDDSHESIYERLPHPGKLAYAGNRGRTSRRSINNDLTRSLERSALSMANVNEEDVEYDDIETIPFTTSSSHPPQPPVSEDSKRSSHKDAKSSWLERRNYIKLFPKFMFSSRSSFSSSSPPDQQANNNIKQTRPTGKSGTLDMSNSSIKFRRTRSSQNLKVTG